MKHTILDEIRRISCTENLSIDRQNTNRYRVILKNENYKTAYYFSTPIYRISDRKLVSLCFLQNNGVYEFFGSNAKVVIKWSNMQLTNKEGNLSVFFDSGKPFYLCSNELRNGDVIIRPSLNGIAIEASVKNHNSFFLKLSPSKRYKVKSNSNCIAFMAEKFKPFASITAICGYKNQLCFPVKLICNKRENNEYSVALTTQMHNVDRIIFEINLYEEKLFQDTTVDSKHPKENNAYGGTAFLCGSKSYGEQWLYSRLDVEKLSDLFGLYIKRVQLYIPKYSDSDMNVTAYKLDQKFCSFGSTWNNKIPVGSRVSELEKFDDYYVMDISNLIIGNNHQLHMNDGILLKAGVQENGFTVIATGDNYYTPQILAIDYKYNNSK